MIKRIETASIREEKIRKLLDDMLSHCGKFYDSANKNKKAELHSMMNQLNDVMVAYRAYKIPWDSKLIDDEETIYPNPDEAERVKELVDSGQATFDEMKDFGHIFKMKTQKLSTMNSVMDKAREIFVFINSRDSRRKQCR